MSQGKNNSAKDETGLRPIMGTGSLVAFGLAYLVPLTIFTTFGLVTTMTNSHVPMAYLVTLLAMFFTAMSYATLAKYNTSSGSAYAYAKQAFGQKIGFVTGWVLLLDYLLLPAINYLIIGIYVSAQFPMIPESLVILSCISLVAGLNIIGVSSVRNVSLLLVSGQLLFAAVFLGLVIFSGNPDVDLLAPFTSPSLIWGPVFAGAAILCLSFLGFDAVSTMSEEARDPHKTVPRAIIYTTVIGGGLFIVLSYAATLVMPDASLINDADSAGIEIMNKLGGQILVAFFLAAYLAGCIASAVASQASVSRVLYVMGRDNVLPQNIFGVLNEKFQTPVRAILIVALISLIVLFVSLDFLASVISFGALFAFSLVNLSVIKKFFLIEKQRSSQDLLKYVVFPMIGFAFTVWLWFSLSSSALILGLSWLAIGAVYLLVRGNASLNSKDIEGL